MPYTETDEALEQMSVEERAEWLADYEDFLDDQTGSYRLPADYLEAVAA